MPENHSPIRIDVRGVILIVAATIKWSKVANWIERSLESVIEVGIYQSAVSIIWVVEVGKTVVVIVPIDVVLKAITIYIGINSIWPIITEQCSV